LFHYKIAKFPTSNT